MSGELNAQHDAVLAAAEDNRALMGAMHALAPAEAKARVRAEANGRMNGMGRRLFRVNKGMLDSHLLDVGHDLVDAILEPTSQVITLVIDSRGDLDSQPLTLTFHASSANSNIASKAKFYRTVTDILGRARVYCYAQPVEPSQGVDTESGPAITEVLF